MRRRNAAWRTAFSDESELSRHNDCTCGVRRGRPPRAVNRTCRDSRRAMRRMRHRARGPGMQDALKAESASSTSSTPTRTPIGVRAQAPDASALASHPASTPRAPRATAPRTRSGRASTTGEVAGIRVTSARRVIDVQSGIRKLDLVRYYARVAPLLLPHLRDRPVSLVRAPQGLAGETFFQRHSARAPIDGVTQHDGLDPGQPAILSIDTLEALVQVAQMDTIELHTWNALASDVEHPDRVVFDLDPDPALGWDRVIEAAQLTRGVLADLGLESFCKTSGGKGLHVIVPVVPGTSWDESKAFARAVSQRLASGWPTQFTATMGPAHRKKKVYVDYLRNARGASTAVAWGVRARPGMGVSVPIGWDELTQTTGGAHWSLADLDALRARMAQVRRADPWAAYAGVRQAVTSELTLRLEEGGA
ncbi:hypothetical protein EHZ25_23740 [Paraburkholderia tropica]|nr:hypothetical protein G5S35_07570 [Paraburkholderia tropica]RQN36652.1 hypothetical protein EHZ25_23740 [Paraburkholderia tropica]